MTVWPTQAHRTTTNSRVVLPTVKFGRPRLVQTSLDLIDFPSICWFETEFSVFQSTQKSTVLMGSRSGCNWDRIDFNRLRRRQTSHHRWTEEQVCRPSYGFKSSQLGLRGQKLAPSLKCGWGLCDPWHSGTRGQSDPFMVGLFSRQTEPSSSCGWEVCRPMVDDRRYHRNHLTAFAEQASTTAGTCINAGACTNAQAMV